MGKGKGGGSPAPQVSQQQKDDYLAANPDVAADPYFSLHPDEHWQKFGQYESRNTAPKVESQASPSVFEGYESYMKQYSAQQAQYAELVKGQQEAYQQQLQASQQQAEKLQEQQRQQQIARYRSLATETVDSQLKQNLTQAKLHGTSFAEPTEKERKELINKEFKAIMGDSSTDSATATKKKTTTKKVNKKTKKVEEDEQLGGSTLLGG